MRLPGAGDEGAWEDGEGSGGCEGMSEVFSGEGGSRNGGRRGGDGVGECHRLRRRKAGELVVRDALVKNTAAADFTDVAANPNFH